ncbi:Lipase, partial [Lachnellula suecica]
MSHKSTQILTHPILGQLRGRVSSNNQTTQFRNLKYAKIPGRWQDPVLFSQKHKTTFDATKFGPSCPQHPAGFEFDLSLVGDVTLEREKEVREVDEFECLNLVVTTPSGVNPGGRLPVMVCVHGGGFSVGNLSKLVQTSIDIKRPVIAVSINHRLGPFGFLASDELGISGNYGLKDQTCSFAWIQQHIHAFGGDPNNITAFGESAGAICIANLLHTSPPFPLFQRAIIMSGDATVRRPRDMAWQNNHYLSISKHLNLTHLSPAANKEHFLNIPANEFVEALPIFSHWSPNIDGEFLKEGAAIGMLRDESDRRDKPDWCKQILVGDCEHDGSILEARLMHHPKALERLHTSIALSLTDAESEKVLYAYNLYGEPDAKRLYKGLMELGSELRFFLPGVEMRKGWGRKGFRYHFHQPNPVSGKWKGYASHELDLAYLLGDYNAFLPKGDCRLAKEMAGFWVGFAYGEGLSGGVRMRCWLLGLGMRL